MIDWDQIIKANGPAVWRTLYRVLGSRADCDECFQEVFLEAVKTSRRREVRHWPTWLQRLAVSRGIDQLRRRRRTPIGEAAELMDSVAASAVDVSQPAQERERAEQLRGALARLPAQQAEVISLHLLQGWSYEQIAVELDLTVSGVGVLIHRGKLRLRELLQDSLGVRPGGET